MEDGNRKRFTGFQPPYDRDPAVAVSVTRLRMNILLGDAWRRSSLYQEDIEHDTDRVCVCGQTEFPEGGVGELFFVWLQPFDEKHWILCANFWGHYRPPVLVDLSLDDHFLLHWIAEAFEWVAGEQNEYEGRV